MTCKDCIHSDVCYKKNDYEDFPDRCGDFISVKVLVAVRRPHGEWIDTGDKQEYWAEEYQCSICGAKDHWHNYCPNCGADMRGGTK